MPIFTSSDLITDEKFSEFFQQTLDHFRTSYPNDELAPCLKNPEHLGSDPYYTLQLCHLMASPEDVVPLELLMAAYASKVVSNPEHLLAMDMTKDYRGDTWTSKEFNADAYEIGKLFHRKPVDANLFVPFVKHRVIFKSKEWEKTKVMDGSSLRKYALQKVHRHKIYYEISKKLGVPMECIEEAMALAPDGQQGSSLMEKISAKQFARNKDKVIKAVGVSQDWKLLSTAIRCFPSMKLHFMRSFLVGTLQECGKPPLEELRAIATWG